MWLSGFMESGTEERQTTAVRESFMYKKQYLRRPRTKPMIMLATVFVLFLFLLILSGVLWKGSKIQPDPGSFDYREPQWQISGPQGVLSNHGQTGEEIPMDPGEVYIMETKLTYDGSQDSMPCAFLQADHLFCQVSLDGNVLFSYLPENVKKLDHSRSPGFLCKAVSLPSDCQGKKLQIRLQPVLPTVSHYPGPEVSFGDFRTVIRNQIHADLPFNIAAVLCMMLGVSALLFSAASLTGSDYREGFNIGSFSLLVSIYFVTNCRTNFYYISNPYYVYFVNSLAASLAPVAFMGVMRECLPGIQKRICTFVITLLMLFFATEMYLHMAGILDMHELMDIVRMISMGEMLLNSLLFLSVKEKKRRKTLAYQILPILAGMAVDTFVYTGILSSRMDEGAFTTMGVLVFLFSQLAGKLIYQARRTEKMQQQTIEGMATLIEGRDGSTGAHVRNTGVYARMIAEEMYRRHMYPRELTSEFVEMIGIMAPLHDVGKIEISDTILNKPGKFTPEEYEIMKTHAALGGQIIGRIMHDSLEPDMLQMAMDIATHHHERWDGTGYPDGLKGREIPLCARIMAAADVFDALSSKRVYKPEMDIDEVFREMVKNEDKQFQKEIVEVVLSLRPQLEAYLAKAQKAEKKQKTM